MPALASKLVPRSEDFKANAAAMRALVDDLNVRLAAVVQGGGEASRAKHLARGKLLPRDRVEMLLDPDTPFLEVAPLAALGLYGDAAPGAGRRIAIQPQGRERRHFEEGRVRVQQHLDPVARQQLAAREVLGARRLAAALNHGGKPDVQVVDERAHRGGIRLEVFGAGNELRGECRHGVSDEAPARWPLAD